MRSDEDTAEKRLQMVETQIKPRGIHDPATLDSLEKVPRHLFVPENLQPYAYDDGPLKIGHGQVISQPYLVGLMTQAAEAGPTSKVLEIGTGSGYQAAVLANIAKEVYTVERIPELAQQAAERFEKIGYRNIHAKIDDGTLGWPEHAPFDAIVVTAATDEPPEAFLQQLKPGGNLVIPLGDSYHQDLFQIHKNTDNTTTKKFLEHVRFVPLIGN